MTNSQLIWKNQTQLRTGYTTGSCAAAAAKAAAHMLFTGEEIHEISLMTPAGVELYLDVRDVQITKDAVSCAIQKDSGDDPDVTHGALVYAKVSRRMAEEDMDQSCFSYEEDDHLILRGGIGVGVVTKIGLEQEVGKPAINRVPRSMILKNVSEERIAADADGEYNVTISIPKGVELAAKTFNPKLGIEGGISVLGTSGIVQPMSEKALTDTILVEMKMRRANGLEYCFIVPGNYGTDFLKERFGYDEEKTVKCSNYVGETIDDAVNLHMKGILMVGHVGKFVKLAAGIMNTHSHQADGRLEILAAHAAMAGADRETVKRIMSCVTTTAALEILKEKELLEETMRTIMTKIKEHVERRAGETLEIGVVVFSKEEGILGATDNAYDLAERIQKQS